jgi:hypothetical protein
MALKSSETLLIILKLKIYMQVMRKSLQLTLLTGDFLPMALYSVQSLFV